MLPPTSAPSTFSRGVGRPMEKPCPYSTPSARVACQIASLSTHSATVCSFMARASCTMALSIAWERSSVDDVAHEDAVDLEVRDRQRLQVT